MSTLRTIQRVSGTTLTVAVPTDWAGQDVEVTIQPVHMIENPLPPEQDPRYARYIMPKPSLTEEQKREFGTQSLSVARDGRRLY